MSAVELVNPKINIKQINNESMLSNPFIHSKLDRYLTKEQILKAFEVPEYSHNFEDSDFEEFGIESALLNPEIINKKNPNKIGLNMFNKWVDAEFIIDNKYFDMDYPPRDYRWINILANSFAISSDVQKISKTRLSSKEHLVDLRLKSIKELEDKNTLNPKITRHNLNYLFNTKILFPNKDIKKYVDLIFHGDSDYVPGYISISTAKSVWNSDGREMLKAFAQHKVLKPEIYKNYDFTNTTIFEWALELVEEARNTYENKESSYGQVKDNVKMNIEFLAYLNILAAKDVKIIDGKINIKKNNFISDVKGNLQIPLERSFT